MSKGGPLGITVMGAGHWGPNLIRNFHSGRQARVRWVVDRDASRLERVKNAYPDILLTSDPGEAIADPEVSAVVVATPTVTHFELVRLALKAGKHVLVEKPIATRSQDGIALRDLAREEQLVLMVGHVFLYNAGVRRVREVIQSGDLGEIHYLSMVRTNLGPIRTDVNVAWDLASQDISIANYWLDGQPRSASARGGVWINPGREDAVFATLTYPGNVLVHLHVSWLHPRKAREMTVVGERRMLTLDDMDMSEPLRIYDKHVDGPVRVPFTDSFVSFRASIKEGDVTIPRVALSEPLTNECAHFLECVREGREPVTNADQAIAVVRALEAIDRSLRNDGKDADV